MCRNCSVCNWIVARKIAVKGLAQVTGGHYEDKNRQRRIKITSRLSFLVFQNGAHSKVIPGWKYNKMTTPGTPFFTHQFQIFDKKRQKVNKRAKSKTKKTFFEKKVNVHIISIMFQYLKIFNIFCFFYKTLWPIIYGYLSHGNRQQRA